MILEMIQRIRKSPFLYELKHSFCCMTGLSHYYTNNLNGFHLTFILLNRNNLMFWNFSHHTQPYLMDDDNVMLFLFWPFLYQPISSDYLHYVTNDVRVAVAVTKKL